MIRHLVQRQPEQHRDLLPDQERVLARGPQGQLAALPVRDRGVGLHRVLVDGREGVLALDDHRGVREGLADLAAAERVAVADVAVGVGQVAEAVCGAGTGPLLVDQGRVRGQGGVHAGRDRQFFVLGVDQGDGGLGGGLGLGRDDGDRLAYETDLAEGHDRAVAQGVAVVRVEVRQVGAGQDGDHAVGPLGRRGVHRADPGVSQGAVQDRRVEHAGELDVAGELGLAGELERAVGTLDAAAHGTRGAGWDGGGRGAHAVSSRVSVRASRRET